MFFLYSSRDLVQMFLLKLLQSLQNCHFAFQSNMIHFLNFTGIDTEWNQVNEDTGNATHRCGAQKYVTVHIIYKNKAFCLNMHSSKCMRKTCFQVNNQSLLCKLERPLTKSKYTKTFSFSPLSSLGFHTEGKKWPISTSCDYIYKQIKKEPRKWKRKANETIFAS